jgi:hypothetical protein
VLIVIVFGGYAAIDANASFSSTEWMEMDPGGMKPVLQMDAMRV